MIICLGATPLDFPRSGDAATAGRGPGRATPRLDTGDIVDDFTASDHSGARVRLSELVADGPIVVYFCSRTFADGWTAEACHFRDLTHELAMFDARPVGVSRDDAATQARSWDEHELGHPLLSDPDGAISRLFGTGRPAVWSRRATFVIDRERRVLVAIRSERDLQVHTDEALAVLART